MADEALQNPVHQDPPKPASESDVDRIVELWPHLPQFIRQAIITLVESNVK